MRFSVVIPTYNRANKLDETVQNMLEQTYTDFEIMVVDDGSTDNTKDVVTALQKEDERIVYVYQENAGASAARNTGVRHARGDIIVYMDSDDTADVRLLEIIDETLQQHPSKTYGICNHMRHIVLIDKEEDVLDEHKPFVMTDESATLQDYYYWNVKTTSSGFFHDRKLAKKYEWDESLRYLEDWELLLQFGNHNKDGFVFIDEPLISYTQSYGGDGMCSNAGYSDWAEAFDYIYHKHKDDLLMAGQTWWPDRVEKYTRIQAEVDAGTHEPQVYKYFPEYKKNIA